MSPISLVRPSLLLFVLVGLAACSKPAPPPSALRTVLVQQVAARTAGQSFSFSGEVRARHEADLAFRVGGKLMARLVDAGAEVKAGTPLARLDPADLQLAQQSARAQLAAAESDAATSQAERARYADLLGKKFVSQAAFDAKDNVARAASARLEQARAQAAVSGNQLNYGTLVADQSGVITAVLADAGQVVAAGQPVVRLARPEEKEVLIAVPESRVGELRAARDITITFWALPELRLSGKLRELSPAADAATRTYAARISLPKAPPEVRLGMTAQVTVAGSGPAAAPEIVVPSAAVIDQGQGAAVWLVVEGKVKRQPVTVRAFAEDGAHLSAGLQGGETLVVVGASRLAEGLAVRTQPVAETAK